MGKLVAVGGIAVAAQELKPLETRLAETCRAYGFPDGEEFKWSPRRKQWMRSGLRSDDRSRFFLEVIQALADGGCRVLFVMEDASRARATGARSPELDVTRLFLERVDSALNDLGADGIVIADRPGGSRSEEDEFLEEFSTLLQEGTDYVKPTRIAMNVLTADSHKVRSLQAADLVTGATLAYVAGDRQHAPTLAAALQPLFLRASGRVGGVGVKLHPDFSFRNLYHWLFHDEYWLRKNMGVPYPLRNRPYSSGPLAP